MGILERRETIPSRSRTFVVFVRKGLMGSVNVAAQKGSQHPLGVRKFKQLETRRSSIDKMTHTIIQIHTEAWGWKKVVSGSLEIQKADENMEQEVRVLHHFPKDDPTHKLVFRDDEDTCARTEKICIIRGCERLTMMRAGQKDGRKRNS